MTTFGKFAEMFPSDDDDDEDDEEYVPGAEESSGEEVSSEEEEEEEDNGGGQVSKKPTKRKATRKTASKNDIAPRKRRRGCFEVPEEEKESKAEDQVEAAEKLTETAEAGKESEDDPRSDFLWKNFLQKSSRPLKREVEVQKTKVEELYDFAGETIRLTKEVDTSSKTKKTSVSDLFASRTSEQTPDVLKSKTTVTATTAQSSSLLPPSPSVTKPSGILPPNGKPGGGSGVSGLLDKLKGKKKMSVLDKSRLDWNTFTHAEGIKEELQIFNRGKEGYLEKVAFLERADYRQFEMERDVRLGVKRPSKQ